MADIEVVVKIPEEDIEYLEEKYKKGYASRQELALIKAVAKNHILPKGHGRLGDLDHYQERLKVKYNECDAMTGSGVSLAYEMAYGEPTIIEADKGSK